MFVNLFSKKGEDYTRYWVSVSTEKYNAKKGKGTGEYINASMPVRLSEDAKSTFNNSCVKTSNKKIMRGRFEVDSGWLESVEPKEGEPYVRLFILEMTDASEDD